MRYFHISNGLRGCYMPDSAGVYAFATRRELRSYIEREAQYMGENTVGMSKAAISKFCALAWRRDKRDMGLPHCLPTKQKGESSYSYGVFISNATREEYLEYCNSQD